MYIAGNVVEGHRDGIYFEFVTNSVIENNQSMHNVRYGLHFMFSHHNSYVGNQFSGNGAGVAVMFSNHVTMSKNVFSDNRGSAAYGILMKEISDSWVEGNYFLRNTTAFTWKEPIELR
jgi:nitrous oxidase accessory protein